MDDREQYIRYIEKRIKEERSLGRVEGAVFVVAAVLVWGVVLAIWL